MNELEKLEKAKQDIQDKIDKLKSKPELNKWFKHKNNKHPEWIFYINEDFSSYGINSLGDWVESNHKGYLIHLEPATNEEVEAALIKEAKKRGFKKGVKFNGITNKSIVHRGLVMPLVFDSELNELTDDNDKGWTIFRDGHWAEAMQETKVVIKGYEMKQEGDIISFGCAKLKSESLINLNGMIDGNAFSQ